MKAQNSGSPLVLSASPGLTQALLEAKEHAGQTLSALEEVQTLETILEAHTRNSMEAQTALDGAFITTSRLLR